MGETKKGRVRRTFWANAGDYSKLTALAAQQHIGVGDLLRQLIQDYVNEKGISGISPTIKAEEEEKSPKVTKEEDKSVLKQPIPNEIRKRLVGLQRQGYIKKERAIARRTTVDGAMDMIAEVWDECEAEKKGKGKEVLGGELIKWNNAMADLMRSEKGK